jgi:protein-serine/threonine kinase
MDTETHLEEGEKRISFVGTHEYVAPEIIAEEGYVGSVDWWAFGILLYEMIYATTPFKGSTQIQTLENILDVTEEIQFPSNIKISETCKDLIRKLLAKVWVFL